MAGCLSQKDETPRRLVLQSAGNDSSESKSYSYAQLKEEIEASRKQFSMNYQLVHNNKELFGKINNYWVNTVSNDLYLFWKDTPWDFNGTTNQPGQGTIACGFFVATLLQDMGLKVNRRKLSVCASSQMMKSLVPQATTQKSKQAQLS